MFDLEICYLEYLNNAYRGYLNKFDSVKFIIIIFESKEVRLSRDYSTLLYAVKFIIYRHGRTTPTHYSFATRHYNNNVFN